MKLHENTLVKAGQRLAFIASAVSACSLFLLMTMTFLDVVMRSTLNNPIEAATEMTRLFMAIIVFSSLPIISWRGEHIVVDLMDPLFKATLARIRDAIINLVCGILLIWPALKVWQLAERARSYGDVTEYLHIPQFYIAWFIGISTFITAIIFIIRGLCFIFAPALVTKPETETQNEETV